MPRCRFLLFVLVSGQCLAQSCFAIDRALPFAHEIRVLSHEQPRRVSQANEVHRPGFAKPSGPSTAFQQEKMRHEAVRQGPVMPPLIDFINEIDNGLTMPSTTTSQGASWILRAYNPRMGIPDADILPNLNMRQPTPF